MTDQGRRGVVSALVLAGVVTGLVAGCGSASVPSPPTGVDELVVPTPTPEPDDFVDVVDNAWLSLEVGETTSYTTGEGTTVAQRVEAGPVLAGVATTAVTLGAVTDLYAQDRRGNVWWFGRDGAWQAGVDGAQAGLVMPAAPRVGDGWRRAAVPGSALLAEVVELDPDAVVLELTTDGEVVRASYVDGVGLVSTTGQTAGGPAELTLDEAP